MNKPRRLEPGAKDPRQLELEKLNASLARHLKDSMPDRNTGFALLTFDLGKGGFLAYCSSADRADMLRAMKEFIANNEAAEQSPGN